MKTDFLLIVLSLCIISSCSKRSVISEAEQVETLKSLSEKKIREVYWTDPLESGRLQEDISKIPGISPELRISPIMMIAAKNQEQNIYPSFADFGSLDISVLPATLFSIVEEFSAAIINDTDADQFMVKSSLFNLALFYEDLRSSNRLNMTDYIIGEPFTFGDDYEVPVRFSSSSGSVDVKLFFIQEGDTWKIDQIQFK